MRWGEQLRVAVPRVAQALLPVRPTSPEEIQGGSCCYRTPRRFAHQVEREGAKWDGPHPIRLQRDTPLPPGSERGRGGWFLAAPRHEC
jgi:hypothetical protein